MKGVVPLLLVNSSARIRVRVYNLKDTALRGVCRLAPRNDWREWPWNVSPASRKLELAPNGWAEAEFMVEIPFRDTAKEEHYFYFDAVFTPETPGAEFRDTLVARAVARMWGTPDAWKLYKSGYQLERSSERFVIRRNEGAEASVLLVNGDHPVFARNEAELPAGLSLSFRSDGPRVKAVSLMLRDAAGEIFQIRTALPTRKEGEYQLKFDLSCYLSGKNLIVWNNGNRDRKIDWPISQEGFIFEFDSDGRAAGSLIVFPPEAGDRNSSVGAVSAGGGAENMDE